MQVGRGGGGGKAGEKGQGRRRGSTRIVMRKSETKMFLLTMYTSLNSSRSLSGALSLSFSSVDSALC